MCNADAHCPWGKAYHKGGMSFVVAVSVCFFLFVCPAIENLRFSSPSPLTDA